MKHNALTVLWICSIVPVFGDSTVLSGVLTFCHKVLTPDCPDEDLVTVCNALYKYCKAAYAYSV